MGGNRRHGDCPFVVVCSVGSRELAVVLLRWTRGEWRERQRQTKKSSFPSYHKYPCQIHSHAIAFQGLFASLRREIWWLTVENDLIFAFNHNLVKLVSRKVHAYSFTTQAQTKWTGDLLDQYMTLKKPAPFGLRSITSWEIRAQRSRVHKYNSINFKFFSQVNWKNCLTLSFSLSTFPTSDGLGEWEQAQVHPEWCCNNLKGNMNHLGSCEITDNRIW
jgi:hypothetical protein